MIAQDRRVATRQWLVLALVLVALVIDGVDTQLLALVAPRIMAEWQVDKASFGPAMSAALFGMALGAGIGGWLGDRLGRKTVLVGAMLLFGAATAGVSLARGLPMLIGLRLASGLGFGALSPNGAALAAEWLPDRLRSRAMALLSIPIPLGGLIGGSAVLTLMPALGWAGCFALCGIGTLVLAGVMIVLLPESPGYLAMQGGHDAAATLVERVTGTLPPLGPAEVATEPQTSVFTRANLRLNLGAWLSFFSLQLIAYGFLSWAPVFLTMVGWPLAKAIQGTLVFNLSAVAASFVAGWLLERFRFRTVALGGSLGAGLCLIALYALATSSPAPLPVTHEIVTFAAITGVSVLAGFGITSVYALLSFAYPTGCRANGIGLGLMTGRTGGITIALTGGVLLALAGNSLLPFFAVLLTAAGLAAVGILVLGPAYAGRLGD